MAAPDKKPPKKRFFKLPAIYFELSQEEQSKYHLHAAPALHASS